MKISDSDTDSESHWHTLPVAHTGTHRTPTQVVLLLIIVIEGHEVILGSLEKSLVVGQCASVSFDHDLPALLVLPVPVQLEVLSRFKNNF